MPHFRYLTDCWGSGCAAAADDDDGDAGAAAWREVLPSAMAWKKSAKGDT